MAGPPERVDARGMRCPWPVLRAARALRSHDAIVIEADDPMAPAELAALAAHNSWHFAELSCGVYTVSKAPLS
jgi:tRNA 2-thiouridine synthesizing protein A